MTTKVEDLGNKKKIEHNFITWSRLTISIHFHKKEKGTIPFELGNCCKHWVSNLASENVIKAFKKDLAIGI